VTSPHNDWYHDEIPDEADCHHEEIEELVGV
jgi:hypothetical protein